MCAIYWAVESAVSDEEILFRGLEGTPKQIYSRLGATLTVFNEGDVLAHAGANASCFWVIVDGAVKIKPLSDERSPTVIDRGPGSVIGEQGIVDQARQRTATAVAARMTRAYVIHVAALERLKAEERALIWRNIAEIISAKLAQATKDRAAAITERHSFHAKLLPRLMNKHGLAHFDANESFFSDLEVVVWFSDLACFSTFAQHCSAAELATVISEAMSRQSEIIDASGGFVDKFMGDAVMAYWIVEGPSLRPDRAAQALKAASDAVKSVRGIKLPNVDATLDLRIGLRIGSAKCGNFGSKDRWAWTLIGDDVNVGARLEQARSDNLGQPLGPLRICEDLYRHLQSTDQQLLDRQVCITTKEGRSLLIWTGG
jgi:class 3 adenylate cyclase